MFSAVCTRLFHHGVSVCLQGNQFLHVAVACCSARRSSTSGHKRPCQLMPKPGSCLCPRHSKQLLHVNFFTAREEIKATTPIQRAWNLRQIHQVHMCASVCISCHLYLSRAHSSSREHISPCNATLRALVFHILSVLDQFQFLCRVSFKSL